MEVSKTGQCGKFVVSNDYVRIPKLGNSLCSGVVNGTIPVVGNDMTLGWTNGTQTGGMRLSGTTNQATIESNLYGTQVGTANTTANAITRDVSVGITTDPTKSGIEAKINSVEVFYYMVVSTEGQTAEVGIDINQVYEDLNIKANGDLSNVASVAQSFKEQSVSWGMPDYTAKYSAVNNKMYTLDYNCIVSLYNDNAYLYIYDKNGTNVYTGSCFNQYPQVHQYIVPVGYSFKCTQHGTIIPLNT